MRESGHRGVHSDGILKLWPVYDRIISGHRMVSGPMATSTTGLFLMRASGAERRLLFFISPPLGCCLIILAIEVRN